VIIYYLGNVIQKLGELIFFFAKSSKNRKSIEISPGNMKKPSSCFQEDHSQIEPFFPPSIGISIA
jgi:hypothetical protein